MTTSDDDFSLRRIAIPVFGPSVLFGIATGAMMPIIALRAGELGASAALAGFMAALVGLGSMVSNLPAAVLTARIGERRAIILAATFGLLGGVFGLLAQNLWLLGLGVVILGGVTAIFNLARQGYLTERVPFGMRARALSTLGGSSRIGVFVGPFLASWFIHHFGLNGAFWVVIAANLATGALTMAYPELPSNDDAQAHSAAQRSGKGPSLLQILHSHRHIFQTLGVGVVFFTMLRACRQVAIPLWGDHLGMAPATVTLIYGLTSAVDMLAFYPAGSIMDRYGRLWIALPSSLLMGLGLVLMPLAHGETLYVIISLMMGLGNGIGSGILMTLAADSAPAQGRPQFLGLWRLMSDLGACSGPFVLSGLTAAFTLGVGVSGIGALGLLSAALFWHWMPHGKSVPKK